MVDWSDATPDRQLQLLRAAVPVGGRALTIYKEIHPLIRIGNARIHRRFLQALKQVLPDHCSPILVSDAGFRNPWFRAVRAMGWDFVGRVGGHTMTRADEHSPWVRVEELFARATARPRYLGEIEVARSAPLHCHAYSLKRPPKGRIKKTRFGTKSRMQHSLKNAHRERTPWLLVTSLADGAAITRRVINLYRTRMQIEQSFRDLKNGRWGSGLEYSMTTIRYRFENLLMLGSLAPGPHG